jgi:hypothetical protein
VQGVQIAWKVPNKLRCVPNRAKVNDRYAVDRLYLLFKRGGIGIGYYESMSVAASRRKATGVCEGHLIVTPGKPHITIHSAERPQVVDRTFVHQPPPNPFGRSLSAAKAEHVRLFRCHG